MSFTPPDDGLAGLAPISHLGAIGIMPNAQQQTYPGFMTGASYELAIVEFDDQGRCYDRKQMEAVATRLDALRAEEKDVIILVFTHGWQHDARTDDENLSAFRGILARTVIHEQSSTEANGTPRPVLGIFVGWRGLSEFGLDGAIAGATFWTRQAAGQRVATGSVRELFGRLRHYRNHRLKTGRPLLVIAGHSFGGMIVYSALAQSLIEAASAPIGQVVPSFADLVLLINPAIEGARYLPMYDLVIGPDFQRRTTAQLPVFICAQAENDVPIGTLFPLGNTAHGIEQATIGALEKECVVHAFGFVESFRTHQLGGPAGGEPFVLAPKEMAQINPFWVVGADKSVIDGHGGIWQAPFQEFLASIVFQHVQASKTENRVSPVSETGGGLAAFARTLRPNA